MEKQASGGRGFQLSPVLGVLVVLAVLSPAPGWSDVALAAKASTLGLGAELTVGLSPQLNARIGANAYTYSDRREASDILYDGEAKLRTGTAFLDWHPEGHGFRLTGGVVYNDTAIEGSSVPPASGIYNIGGVPVPAALVGTLDARADFDPLVPYAGFGWGNAVTGNKKLGFFVDLGVVFQGKANVTLTPIIPANSPINTTPGARQALDVLLRREEQDLEDQAADYDLYPVIGIGFSYRF
jgi:hypothetical protein